MDLKDILKQAQALQSRVAEAHAEMDNIEVTGESGAGLVKITLNGRFEARRVFIDPTLLAEDRALLEDLVAAAVTDAARRLEGERKARLAEFTKGMGLPAGFKLPF